MTEQEKKEFNFVVKSAAKIAISIGIIGVILILLYLWFQ